MEARVKGPVKEIQSKKIHKSIKAFSEHLDNFKYNTCISELMVALNDRDWFVKNDEGYEIDMAAAENFVKLLAPFAPHMAEEIWAWFGHRTSVHLEAWPKYDESKLKEANATIVVQIMGKMRATITVEADATQEEVKQMAIADPAVVSHLSGKTIVKEIFVPNRLINFVIS
jgi:leucyl-tRNA synthetase